MNKETLGFIDAHKDERFFLYLSYTLPHANNEAMRKTGDGTAVPSHGIYKNKKWTKQNKGQAAMVTYLDDMVGQVVKRLETHGLDKNTVIFFTSDNGPHSEGGNNVGFFNANGPVSGIKRAMHDGGIRVPMIVQWPARVKAGSTTSLMAGAVDFMATAAEIAGVKLNTPTDGISFLPTLIGKGAEQKMHDYLYWEFYEQGSKQALRAGKWKAIRRPMHTGPIELYDISKDIGEKTDVAAQHPDIISGFEQIFTNAHTPNKRWRPSGKPRNREQEQSEGR
jgi:arylsulfatase A-like enzyme